jgi:hypothetical protein
MGHSQIGDEGDDRLSKLADGVVGHILSFLPAKEAARAAVLSTRWRDVFASVHTVSLEQTKLPVPEGGDDRYRRHNHNIIPGPPFPNGVSAALLARHRRRGTAAPMRSLRVAFRTYFNGMNDHDSMVDQWISYAMQQAGPELHLDLRLNGGDYSLRSVANGDQRGLKQDEHASTDEDSGQNEAPRHTLPNTDEDVGVSNDRAPKDGLYTVPRGVFSCATLRTLCIGPCKLNPPASATNLPSLEILVLIRVADSGRKIHRLISGCPRLVDLTLEDCDAVRALSVLDKRLRRLSLQCCSLLTSVAIDAAELRSFEYKGAVPAHHSLLNMPQGPRRSLSSCKVDLCDKELTSEVDLTRLGEFLHHFASTEHLHLTSARLGSSIGNETFAKRFPAFSTLGLLELTGSLPHDDDTHATDVVAAVARILEHAPNLEVLTLFFKAPPREKLDDTWDYRFYKEEELIDAHHLRYDRWVVFPDAPPATQLVTCLREINLVHYHGGNGQRMLAKFLLGNVARLDALYCGFAEGPLRLQNKLMDEIRGWAMDKLEPEGIMFM